MTGSIPLTNIRSMDALSVRRVRAFNRTTAETIGALDDRFLGRARPMGESRALWEIGPEGTEVRALRARLGLDSGYMSRVLRSLERQGLVAVAEDPDDRRVRRVDLTEAGLAERAELDRRADDVARGFLEPLDDGRRARLVAAMTEVERLLRASAVRLAVEDPTTPDARWCFEQYFSELDARFDAGFDPSSSVSAGAGEVEPPGAVLLMARLRDRPVGCGAIKSGAGATAELKRLWVAPEARGLGLGRRLLGDLERRAQEAGVKILRLETNGSLKEAIGLYRRSGYREIPPLSDEPNADRGFEKRFA